MKLAPLITAALGGGAKVVTTASSLAIVVGAIYLVDCRMNNSSQDSVERCYLTALPMMGLGAGVGGGFMAGYNTYNPALRPEDQPAGMERDEHGRFKRRG